MSEQVEKLLKEAHDLRELLEKQAKEKGTDGGVPKTDAIKTDELEKMKTSILDEVEKKVAASKAPPVEELKEEDQSFGKYLLRLKYKDPKIIGDKLKTVMQSGSDAQGGYTVPTEYSSQIIGELNDMATVTRLMTRYPQSAPTANIPKWLTDLTVYWVDQASSKTASKPTLTRIQSVLKKLTAIVTFTDEYLQDDITGIASRVSKLVAENFNNEIEKVALVGSITNNSDVADGIYFASGTNTVDLTSYGGTLNYEFIVDIWNNSNVLEKYRGNPQWAMNRTSLGKVMKLVDGNNRPLWSLQSIQGKPTNTLLGDPINLSSQIPNTLSSTSRTTGSKTGIFYGDFKYVLLGEKRGNPGINVDISNSAILDDGAGAVSENLWQLDETGYRFVLRKGIVVAVAAAFSVGINVDI